MFSVCSLAVPVAFSFPYCPRGSVSFPTTCHMLGAHASRESLSPPSHPVSTAEPWVRVPIAPQPLPSGLGHSQPTAPADINCPESLLPLDHSPAPSAGRALFPSAQGRAPSPGIPSPWPVPQQHPPPRVTCPHRTPRCSCLREEAGVQVPYLCKLGHTRGGGGGWGGG